MAHMRPTMIGYTRDRTVARRKISRSTFQRILGFARPYRRLLVVFLVVIAIEAALSAIPPWLFRVLIDDGIGNGDRRIVLLTAGGAAGAAVVGAGLSVFVRWTSARIGEYLIRDLRVAVFDRVQRMSLAFFAQARTGALVQRLNGDVVGAQEAFTSTLQNMVANLLSVAFVLAAMASMSWRLTLLSLVLVPVFIAPARWFGTRLSALTSLFFNLSADATHTMTERFSVAGAHLVKSYGDPIRETAAYQRQADEVAEVLVRRAIFGTWFRVGLTVIASLAVAGVYGLGGLDAIEGTLSVGVVVAMAAYLQRLYGPLTALSNLQVDVMTALVSFERVIEVLDLEPSVADAPSAHDLSEDVGRVGAVVQFNHVDFHYPTETGLASLEQVSLKGPKIASQTLHDISFTVPVGAMVAVVGPSGAGKTTISHLLTRMYDPTNGQITIAGTDLRDVTQASLHKVVGVVSQEAHLFHDTVAGNVRYGRPDATDDEVWEALRGARIADVVARLPHRLDTVVGDRGYRLSGGERQRLAIARLLVTSPDVVVLDEATAHLDSESEAAVQAALDEALAGRTSVVIAHRLSTIRHADLIVVVDGGRVVEQGPHSALLAAGGLYSALYRTQFATEAS